MECGTTLRHALQLRLLGKMYSDMIGLKKTLNRPIISKDIGDWFVHWDNVSGTKLVASVPTSAWWWSKYSETSRRLAYIIVLIVAIYVFILIILSRGSEVWGVLAALAWGFVFLVGGQHILPSQFAFINNSWFIKTGDVTHTWCETPLSFQTYSWSKIRDKVLRNL